MLKLVTHMDSRQMYGVYRNQAAAAYLLFHFFLFSFSPIVKLLNFCTLFSGTVRSRTLKLSTHVDSGQMKCV